MLPAVKMGTCPKARRGLSEDLFVGRIGNPPEDSSDSVMGREIVMSGARSGP